MKKTVGTTITNCGRIRSYLAAHPGCTTNEVIKATGIDRSMINRVKRQQALAAPKHRKRKASYAQRLRHAQQSAEAGQLSNTTAGELCARYDIGIDDALRISYAVRNQNKVGIKHSRNARKSGTSNLALDPAPGTFRVFAPTAPGVFRVFAPTKIEIFNSLSAHIMTIEVDVSGIHIQHHS